MAVGLLAYEVSDLCIGKPPVRPLPLSATVGDALRALSRCRETYLSVWAERSPESPLPSQKTAPAASSTCVGKVCMVDVVCYLCAEENVASPSAALSSPVSVLLAEGSGRLVRHVERHSSVLEALDLILEGAQKLVVPLRGGAASRKKPHTSTRDFCWLAPEDLVRFFLDSIGAFSPVPALSVESLGLVRRDFLAVRPHEPALSAVPLIRKALASQAAVAVVTDDGKLVGEISPSALAGCGEAAAAAAAGALATLSAGELVAYLGCGGDLPEEAREAVRARLRRRGMEGMLDLVEEEGVGSDASSSLSSLSSGSSSDEEAPAPAPTRRRRTGERRRGEEAVVCGGGSSLVAVMIRALAHRVAHVWVVEEDYQLAGVVTLPDVIRVFREQLQPLPVLLGGSGSP